MPVQPYGLAHSLFCALALFGALLGCGDPEPAKPDRIVLILADTLRPDRVGAYGGQGITPQMDRLAKEGQKFTEARSAFHFTSFSMASFFTGQIPSLESGRGATALPFIGETLCGMARFGTDEDAACVPDKLDTLAEGLQQAGYWTLAVVANPLLFDPYGYSQGFDEWIEVGSIPGGWLRTGSTREHALERTGDLVNAAIFDALKGRPSDHFFLFAHYLDVHDWPSQKHSYIKGVETFDAYLGELLDYLESENLLDGTTIILTSDHGETLGDKHVRASLGMHLGNPSYDSVLRVPLIVYPAHFSDPAVPIRGQDMKDLILSLVKDRKNPQEKIPARGGSEQFISEQAYQTFQSGRWKSFWPRNGDDPFLVDLRADPGETRDLSDSHADVLSKHRAQIDDLSQELAADPNLLFRDFAEEHKKRLRMLGYLDDSEPESN